MLSVPCESLVSREFSRIFFIFHLSISISRLFNFTFTSGKEWYQKSIHFSFLEKSEFRFHSFFSRKRVNSREISLLDLEAFSFHFSLLEKSESDFHFTFHFSKTVKQIFISLFTSRTFNIHSRRALEVVATLCSAQGHLWQNLTIFVQQTQQLNHAVCRFEGEVGFHHYQNPT